MVCHRCILSVKQLIEEVGLKAESIELGLVKLEVEEISPSQREDLSDKLINLGFQLLDSSKSKSVEKIKNLIISKIHHSEILDLKVNWSQIIASELNQDYNHLSALFSSVESVTIEHFIINQRIERAKELLLYKELNLSEIAFKLGYSSVQYLSTQFKQVTGKTPSQFKSSQKANQQRRPLDFSK
jgi:AraC family transcriptional regulator